jgi:hypothetical protein
MLFHLQWVVTNLRATGPLGSTPSTFSWTFDLNGIAEMYQSYEETNLWYLVQFFNTYWLNICLVYSNTPTYE